MRISILHRVSTALALALALVLAITLAACNGSSSPTGTTGTTSLAIAGGDAQTATVGTALANALSVRVTNAAGTGMAGTAVTFAIASGGGSLSTTAATTDADGYASTVYTAGSTAGTATITASASGLTTRTFTATLVAAASTTPTTNCSTATSGARVVCLVDAFKATLSTSQQASVQLSFTSTLAVRWSNLPCGLTCRNGVLFSTLSSTQLNAALAVAQAALSTAGYSTFDAIRKADTFLGNTSGGYGEGIYVISFLGTPSTTGTWMLQLGGHHYAMNITYTNGVPVSVTPNFVGVEPQTFTLNGTTYAPLEQRKTTIYAMINALDATQLASAKLSSSFGDVLLGPGQDGKFPTQQGVLVSSLSSTQQALVTAAIDAWIRDAPTELATALTSEYTSAASYSSTRIAWSGSTTPNVQGSYVRIDGPRVWIEFICQNGVVYPSQIHFHTIWRDKNKDYGGSFAF